MEVIQALMNLGGSIIKALAENPLVLGLILFALLNKK